MPSTFWTKNGKLVVDAQGRPILCDHCPCGGCGIVPAGSLIEYEVTRRILWVQHKLLRGTGSDSYDIESNLRVDIGWSGSMSYTVSADIPDGDPFPLARGLTYRPTVYSSTAAARFDSRTAYFRASASDLVIPWNPGLTLMPMGVRAAAGGSCTWQALYYFDFERPELIGSLSGYVNDSEVPWNEYAWGANGASYSWEMSSGDPAIWLPSTPIANFDDESMERWSRGDFDRTATGCTIADEAGGYVLRPAIVTTSPEEGTATASISIQTEASFDVTEGGFRQTGEGTESVTDTWSAHWLVTLPDGYCPTCGGI